MKVGTITIQIAIFTLITLSLTLSGCRAVIENPVNKNDYAAEYNAKLGLAYLKQNRLELAHEKLLKALQQNTNSVAANHYYAVLQEKLGQTHSAKKHYQKALRYSKNHPELYNNYGSFLCRQAQYADALAQFTRAIKYPLYKTPEFAYTNAGVCLNKSGQPKNSEAYFRKALQLNPQFDSALYQMAVLNWKHGNIAKAQAFLYRYNDVAKQTPKSLLLCKQIHDKLGERVEADKCLSQLLSNFPTSETVRNLSE